MGADFEELKARQIAPGPGRYKPVGSCPRCRTRKSAGVVLTSVRERSGEGYGTQVRSKSKSLCELCAVEVYEALEAALVKDVELGP